MGADFNNSFTPVFNAVQGTKLTPMMSSGDIAGMFTTAGVSTALLPSSFPITSDQYYSLAVRDFRSGGVADGIDGLGRAGESR